MRHTILRILAAVGTLGVLLSLSPVQAVQSTTPPTETFDGFTPVTETITADWYTFASQKASTFASATRYHGASGNSLFMDQTAAWAASPNHAGWSIEVPGWNACAEDAVGMWMNIDALPDDAGSALNFYLSRNHITSSTADVVGFDIDNDATLDVTNNADTTTVALDTWFDISVRMDLSAASEAGLCDGSYTAQTCVASITLNFNVCSNAAAGTINGAIDTIMLTPSDTAGTFPAQVYVDDITWEGLTEPDPGHIFCAAADEDNFGYDYVEQVEFSDAVATIGLDDFFHFQGDNSDSGYLGKAFTPGSDFLSTIFTIEAGADAYNSVFRTAYTTGATTLTEGTGGDAGADLAAAGNGQNTGNFANNVQVEFTEEDDNWRIKIRQSIGGGALDTILSSALHGNPNTAASYNFTVDSRGTGGPIATIKTYPTGDIILSRETGFSSGTDWKDQWFVAKGDTLINGPANTALNNNDDSGNIPSTCVYDWIGTAVVVGSSGGTPNNEVPDDGSETQSCSTVLCVDSTSVPAGFTVDAFNGFLGVLLVGMVVVGGVGALQEQSPGLRVGGVVIGLFAIMGYLMGLYFGLLPLWPIVVAVIGAVVLLYFKMKGSG